jgi:hypothetical protein
MSLFSVSSFLTYKKGLASGIWLHKDLANFLLISLDWKKVMIKVFSCQFCEMGGTQIIRTLAKFGCRLEREVDFSGTSLYFGNMLEPVI